MKQKIFLTSALAMGFVAPAFAEPERIATFPNAANNEFMQENKVYTNAATADNMDSVYEGNVNAIAEYDIIDYIVNAGQYLPADSETVITCPEGSFCPGISGNVQYNQTTAQGIQTCPSGFGSSADGASSDTQCYRACDMNNMGTSFTNIAHATAVSGNDYYGAGTDTCEPTACVNGWHLKAGVNGSAIASTIGTDNPASKAYIDNSGSFSETGASHGQSYYGINGANAWAVDYGTKGIIKGHGRCSTQSGSKGTMSNGTYPDITTFASLTDETGQEGAKYCYCNVTGYKGTYGTLQSLSSPWVYEHNFGGEGGEGGDASYCANRCADFCAGEMHLTFSATLAFRAAVLGSIESSPAMCEANTITINWNGTTQEAINANNAGTATYGSDVRTPVSATPVKGKTFRGWRFSKPEQTTTGN